jgi:DNA anti-recombination protein RmuC
MNLDYALVTDSSLPEQVKESVNYVSLDKDQWLDLVDYTSDIVNEDPNQKVLFLICARGTPEQEEADRLRKEEAEREEAELYARLRDLERETETYSQESVDREARRQELLQELSKLSSENEALIDAAAEQERLRQEREEQAAERRARLRNRSESIFNGLYGR